jgi:hypothetical protein
MLATILKCIVAAMSLDIVVAFHILAFVFPWLLADIVTCDVA